ncbi:MAG: hypothetical protein LIO69_07730 [Oscillospiraceae bacterium]|nr:hypothetical protein [Oscillospiraceae bacterium]
MDNDYINIVIISVYLRSDIKKSYNIDIIDYMLSWVSGDITAEEMILLVKKLNVEWWDNLKTNSPSFINDDIRNKFIRCSLNYLRLLIQQAQYEKAYCVIDVLHVFPDINISSLKSKKSFWEYYILPFKRKFNDDFFDEFRFLTADL